MILDQLRCSMCTNVITGESSNDVLWRARGANWKFQGASLGDISEAYCPVHQDSEIAAAGGPFWRVGCWTCDWDVMDDDPGERPTTREEAQELAREHRCYEYDYMPEDTWMKSPEQFKEERKRAYDWEQQVKARKPEIEREAAEKKTKEENEVAALIYLRHMEEYGQKWVAFIDNLPYWIALVIIITVFAFGAGMALG